MPPIHIRKAPDALRRVPAGYWRGAPGFVVVCCPFCAIPRALPEGHRIQSDGHVQPSLDCKSPGCGFDRHVTLEGWAA